MPSQDVGFGSRSLTSRRGGSRRRNSPAGASTAKTLEWKGADNKRKSYGAPSGTKPVQGKLEAVGGGSADSPSFPLY